VALACRHPSQGLLHHSDRGSRPQLNHAALAGSLHAEKTRVVPNARSGVDHRNRHPAICRGRSGSSVRTNVYRY
jgi:hypothetical protein